MAFKLQYQMESPQKFSYEMKKVLKCYYDLDVSPCSFDFFHFLMAAELNRIHRKCDEIALIFVSGANCGYRNDRIRTHEQNDMFFKNVLWQGPHLLESCKSILWIDRESEIINFDKDSDLIFPRGYRLEAPNQNLDYAALGIVTAFVRREKPAFLVAPNYARGFVKQFLENFSKKKIITLTTRELSREENGTRTINFREWEKFFDSLNKDQYQVLVIRDTSSAFLPNKLFEDIPEINVASTHLHFRMALYDSAFLNFFKNNGPLAPAFYSKANCVWFNEFDDDICALSRAWYEVNYGMNEGSSFPMTTKNKILFWGKENQSRIASCIDKMNDIYNSGESLSLNDFSSHKNFLYSINASIRYTFFNIRHGALPEDIALFQLLRVMVSKGHIQMDDPLKMLAESKEIQIPNETLNQIANYDRMQSGSAF